MPGRSPSSPRCRPGRELRPRRWPPPWPGSPTAPRQGRPGPEPEARFADAVTTTAVVRRLHDQEPSCTTFAFPAEPARRSAEDEGGDGRFLGASPELLVARRGTAVTCHPLAGTVGLDDGIADAADRRTGTPGPSPVSWPRAKDAGRAPAGRGGDRRALDPRCARSVGARRALAGPAALGRPPGHLVVGHPARRLDGGGPPSVLDLVAALHPTPAVGGVPAEAALACIAPAETVPGGPAGPARSAGSTRPATASG